MSNTEDEVDDELVRAWLDHHSNEGVEDVDTEWAMLRLQEYVLFEPGLAWNVVARVISRAWNSWQATMIGAGPLESLLFHYGTEYLSQLELLVDRGSFFPEVIAAVWASDPEVRQRILRLKRETTVE